jgi:hypothetical protein
MSMKSNSPSSDGELLFYETGDMKSTRTAVWVFLTLVTTDPCESNEKISIGDIRCTLKVFDSLLSFPVPQIQRNRRHVYHNDGSP